MADEGKPHARAGALFELAAPPPPSALVWHLQSGRRVIRATAPPAHQDGSPPPAAGCDGLNVCNFDAHCRARVGSPRPAKTAKSPGVVMPEPFFPPDAPEICGAIA